MQVPAISNHQTGHEYPVPSINIGFYTHIKQFFVADQLLLLLHPIVMGFVSFLDRNIVDTVFEIALLLKGETTILVVENLSARFISGEFEDRRILLESFDLVANPLHGLHVQKQRLHGFLCRGVSRWCPVGMSIIQEFVD